MNFGPKIGGLNRRRREVLSFEQRLLRVDIVAGQ